MCYECWVQGDGLMILIQRSELKERGTVPRGYQAQRPTVT